MILGGYDSQGDKWVGVMGSRVECGEFVGVPLNALVKEDFSEEAAFD